MLRLNEPIGRRTPTHFDAGRRMGGRTRALFNLHTKVARQQSNIAASYPVKWQSLFQRPESVLTRAGVWETCNKKTPGRSNDASLL